MVESQFAGPTHIVQISSAQSCRMGDRSPAITTQLAGFRPFLRRACANAQGLRGGKIRALINMQIFAAHSVFAGSAQRQLRRGRERPKSGQLARGGAHSCPVRFWGQNNSQKGRKGCVGRSTLPAPERLENHAVKSAGLLAAGRANSRIGSKKTPIHAWDVIQHADFRCCNGPISVI